MKYGAITILIAISWNAPGAWARDRVDIFGHSPEARAAQARAAGERDAARYWMFGMLGGATIIGSGIAIGMIGSRRRGQ